LRPYRRWVCAWAFSSAQTRFERSLEIVNAGELEAECDKVQEAIKDSDIEQGIKDFKEYLRDSQDLPDTWSKSKGNS
jgi:hypothetical protein